MQHGLVDVVIVGSDRTTAKGDVCNKISALKRWRRGDNSVPFYAALPYTTIDYIEDGLRRFLLKNAAKMKFTYFGKDPSWKIETVRTPWTRMQMG